MRPPDHLFRVRLGKSSGGASPRPVLPLLLQAGESERCTLLPLAPSSALETCSLVKPQRIPAGTRRGGVSSPTWGRRLIGHLLSTPPRAQACGVRATILPTRTSGSFPHPELLPGGPGHAAGIWARWEQRGAGSHTDLRFESHAAWEPGSERETGLS